MEKRRMNIKYLFAYFHLFYYQFVNPSYYCEAASQRSHVDHNCHFSEVASLLGSQLSCISPIIQDVQMKISEVYHEKNVESIRIHIIQTTSEILATRNPPSIVPRSNNCDP
jgi:hypothetical protein